jgi:hypothetical protein
MDGNQGVQSEEHCSLQVGELEEAHRVWAAYDSRWLCLGVDTKDNAARNMGRICRRQEKLRTCGAGSAVIADRNHQNVAVRVITECHSCELCR